MRKNSPRKWLHACLDLLPVILIPVFMIYSHRHTIDSGSVEIPQNQVVDFNQQLDGFYNFDTSSATVTIIDNNAVVINVDGGYGAFYRPFNYVNGHKYLIDITSRLNYSGVINFADNGSFTYLINNTQNALRTQFIYNSYFVQVPQFNIFTYSNENEEFYLSNLMLFDLTQMFGEGYEPTIQQFNQWYTQDYYDYTLSHKELLKNTSTITYSDTDIMSQFTYQLYNSVDKYFNMGNVFNMTSVYDWFNLNIFNGNASISIFIVWNIVLYEFIMDLLFLLYGLFMWFIDMVEHIMDKPFKSIK